MFPSTTKRIMNTRAAVKPTSPASPTLPDQTMANYLALGVAEAYTAYTDNYTTINQISLTDYNPVQLIMVWEGGSYPWSKQVPVVMGFTASSSSSNSESPHNILILRGTSDYDEAVDDVLSWYPTGSPLVPCKLPPSASSSYGNVNQTLYGYYTQPPTNPSSSTFPAVSLSASLLAAVEALTDQTLPLYISAHSLGTAMTEISVLDVANNSSGSHPSSMFLYNFASLYVGDSTFVNDVENALTASYMFANLSDAIPTMMSLYPDSGSLGYEHVGYPCQFVWQNWEMWANHSLSNTYLPIVSTNNSYWSLLQYGYGLTYPTNLA